LRAEQDERWSGCQKTIAPVSGPANERLGG
jgi:hypothetical protein